MRNPPARHRRAPGRRGFGGFAATGSRAAGGSLGRRPLRGPVWRSMKTETRARAGNRRIGTQLVGTAAIRPCTGGTLASTASAKWTVVSTGIPDTIPLTVGVTVPDVASGVSGGTSNSRTNISRAQVPGTLEFRTGLASSGLRSPDLRHPERAFRFGIRRCCLRPALSQDSRHRITRSCSHFRLCRIEEQ